GGGVGAGCDHGRDAPAPAVLRHRRGQRRCVAALCRGDWAAARRPGGGRGRLAAMAGASVPVQPSPGVLLALAGRLCELVVNRLHPAGDGDIVVPQRRLSIVGTSSWTVEDPDDLAVPEEHVQAMYREGAKLVPAVASAAERAAWAAARPLIGTTGGTAAGGGARR